VVPETDIVDFVNALVEAAVAVVETHIEPTIKVVFEFISSWRSFIDREVHDDGFT